MGYSDAAPVGYEDKENLLDLKTKAPHKTLVNAINEVSGLVAKATKVVHCAVDKVSGTIPALPAGSIIIGIRAHVSQAYPSGATIEAGDHSGTSGAAAPTALRTSIGTVTALGDIQNLCYATPVGDIVFTIAGGDGSTGASVIMVEYIDG